MSLDDILGPILEAGRPLLLDDSPQTIPTWDSVRQVEVVLAVEEALGCDLTADEIGRMDSIRRIVAVAQARGVAFAVGG
jgi:hypothetical protein